MTWEQRATDGIDRLLAFGFRSGLIEEQDAAYYRNLLLDAMKMDAPASELPDWKSIPESKTATALLRNLCDLAVEKQLIEDIGYARDLFSGRLMGLLTPSPREVREIFASKAADPVEATDWFFNMCCACDYIKVDAIAQNIRYFQQTSAGELEITINLSKPEKDPKEIAKLKDAPSVGYPKCMLCIENPGYAGRSNFPARQNHRIIPITLAGAPWFLQYSPYAYYHEHCIVFNRQHIPMKIDRGTFERLFSFVGQFPHYFLGSNADLPIVGGSILNHDHFQGGRYEFPMDKAEKEILLKSNHPSVAASILNWPMSTILLEGTDQNALIEEADRILKAWRSWTDESVCVYAETDGTPHNTITPILRREGDLWKLKLVLRNNLTSEEHPLGIYHPHSELHHIKKENIGLIEVMGLFILPGRLKTELAGLVPYLTGEKPLVRPSDDDPEAKHFDWISEIVSRCGVCSSAEEAQECLHREVGNVCAQVLADAGVFKQTEEGRSAMLRFLASLGYQKQ